jgi:hypothetical protein
LVRVLSGAARQDDGGAATLAQWLARAPKLLYCSLAHTLASSVLFQSGTYQLLAVKINKQLKQADALDQAFGL